MTDMRLSVAALVAVVSWHTASAQDRVGHSDTLRNVDVVSNLHHRDQRSTSPEYSVGREDFARMGVSDISGALHRLPGVTLRDYGGAGGMKTVSVRGFGAQHTGVIYDGVALGDCQSGQIDLSRYSLDNVAALSLMVGDNSDIFVPARNAASAATLAITTQRKNPEDEDMHLTAQMRMGSWGLTNPFMRFEKNLSKKWGLAVMGEYLYAENDYPYTIRNVTQTVEDRRKNTLMSSGHGEATLAFRPDRSNTLTLKGYYYDNSRRLPGMVHYYVNENLETLRDQNAFGHFTWRSELSSCLRLSVIGKYNYSLTDYRDPSYKGNIMDRRYKQRETYGSACLLYLPVERLALDYSADYAYNTFEGSDQAEYRDPVRHTVLQSLTARYTMPRLTFMARALMSLYYNDTITGASADDVHHLSPSLSMHWQMLADEKLFLRLSYKDIFRAPSFNEAYYRHSGSTDVKPECTKQWNIGVTWSHAFGTEGTTDVAVSLDGYINHVTDKIVSVPQTMFIWSTINMGSVRTLGIDMTLALAQTIGSRQQLLFSGNATLQKVRNRTNEESPYYDYQIAYTPEFTGAASLAWENPWVNVSVNVVGVSSRWANNEHYKDTRLEGYADCGVSLYRDVRIGNCMMKLRADVRNVFNKQYEVVRFYPMPGRNIQFTVNINI